MAEFNLAALSDAVSSMRCLRKSYETVASKVLERSRNAQRPGDDSGELVFRPTRFIKPVHFVARDDAALFEPALLHLQCEHRGPGRRMS